MENRISEMSEVDRISDIHPSILCHILSRLPTKDAVQTSSLAKEWRCKWNTVYDLNITIGRKTRNKDNRDAQRFRIFAQEKMFLLSPIRNVSFFWYNISENDSRWAETWLCTLLRRNTSIESLKLIFVRKLTTLPHSLLSTNSLKYLELNLFPFPYPNTKFGYRVPAEIFFPNLKCLYLENVEIHNESSDNNILTFTLPLVDKIVLSCCQWVNVKSVRLYTPELTTFSYKNISTSAVEDGIPIEIVGTKLATFHCRGFPENLVMSTSKVMDIVFSNLTCRGRLPFTESELLVLIRRLLEEFSGLKNLELSECWLRAITETGFPVPLFDHLRRLVVINRKYSGAPISVSQTQIIRLLHAMPNLKYLKILMSENAKRACDEVEPVPPCISIHLEELAIDYSFSNTVDSARIISNLEKVEFDYLAAQGEVFNLPKFIIKYGVSLKKVDFVHRYYKVLGAEKQVKCHNVKYSRTNRDSEFSIVENRVEFEGDQ